MLINSHLFAVGHIIPSTNLGKLQIIWIIHQYYIRYCILFKYIRTNEFILKSEYLYFPPRSLVMYRTIYHLHCVSPGKQDWSIQLWPSSTHKEHHVSMWRSEQRSQVTILHPPLWKFWISNWNLNLIYDPLKKEKWGTPVSCITGDLLVRAIMKAEWVFCFWVRPN
jgi:hypothetical protein